MVAELSENEVGIGRTSEKEALEGETTKGPSEKTSEVEPRR